MAPKARLVAVLSPFKSNLTWSNRSCFSLVGAVIVNPPLIVAKLYVFEGHKLRVPALLCVSPEQTSNSVKQG